MRTPRSRQAYSEENHENCFSEKEVLAGLFNGGDRAFRVGGVRRQDRGDAAGAVYGFEGIADVHISVSVSEYDFKAGVTAFKDLAECGFTADASAVAFGTAGKSVVTYKTEGYAETADVYIYGDPAFASSSDTISYADAHTPAGLAKGLTAADTFGNPLTVTATSAIAPGAHGFIEYGAHTVDYRATDRVGNVKTYTRAVTVSDAGRPDFGAFEIDLADPEAPIPLNGLNILKILSGDAVLGAEAYTAAGGYLVFNRNFIVSKDLDAPYEFTVVTAAGYGSAELTVTDNRPALFSMSVADMEYKPVLTLGKAQRHGDQRNITFEYALAGAGAQNVPLADNAAGLQFNPGTESVFTLTVSAKRNGTQDAGSEAYTFKVHDDLLAIAVNQNDEYSEVMFAAESETAAAFTAERKQGTDIGSMHLANTGGSGVVKLRFLPTGRDFASVKEIEFWVYNPTGLALEAYVWTNSGYWELQPAGGNVLTDTAAISADAEWQKVRLAFKPGFTDLSLDALASGAVAELRIVNPDGWLWSGAGAFGVYIGNIYLVKAAADYGVNWGTGAAWAAEGMTGESFDLPTASAADPRVSFAYALKDPDGAAVSYSGGSFTPASEGEYILTVEAYTSKGLAARRDIAIQIGPVGLKLFAAPYYTFGADGLVTLPAAAVPSALNAPDGAALRYSVKLGDADKTADFDQNTRVFNTRGEKGDYTYKAELMNEDGQTPESEVSVTVKLHGDNVFLAFGDDRDTAETNRNTGLPGLTFTYTADKAAPGELGSLLLDNSASGEKGNVSLQIAGMPNVESASMLTFWIYIPAGQNIEVVAYSAPTWLYSNYWFGGTKYTALESDFPIAPQEGWQKVEMLLTSPAGTHVSGGDIRLYFRSSGYGWPAGAPAQIYLSNIYYTAPAPTYGFDGLSNVRIAAPDATFDFASGVTAYRNGTEQSFTVESAGVAFGTAGRYTVGYTVEAYTAYRDVYIYGEPVFTDASGTITYVDAQLGAWAKGLTAADSFGQGLTVTVTGGAPALDALLGVIKYGNYTVYYSATDIVGNVKTFSRAVTVSDSDKPVFPTWTVDFTEIDTAEFAVEDLAKLVYDGVALTPEADYTYAGGKVKFARAFIAGKSPNTYTLTAVTAAGYNTVSLAVTDATGAGYGFDGLSAIRLQVSAGSFDSEDGVTGYKLGNGQPFTVESAGVAFGTAGHYKVGYTIETYTAYRDVYIYGEPVFTDASGTITYVDAQLGAWAKGLTAADSFGQGLTVTVTGGAPAFDALLGVIKYGNYTVYYSATDIVGNVKTFSRAVTVSDSDKPVFLEGYFTVDLSDTGASVDLQGMTIHKVVYNGGVVGSETYSVSDGKLTFTKAALDTLGAGSHTFTVVMTTGYTDAALIVTDDRDANFVARVSDYAYAATLAIPAAALAPESAQRDIAFEYALKNARDESVPLIQNNGWKFSPRLDSLFTLTVTAKRGGAQDAGSREVAFKVHDDLLAMTVNQNDEYTDVTVGDGAAAYTTAQRHGSDLGSTLLQNTGAGGTTGFLILPFAANDRTFGASKSIYFYLYNPTGIALGAYVFVNSGYWFNIGLSVLTEPAEISAGSGWQKVTLAFKSGFGDLDLSGVTPGNAELRIYNPDGWKWDGEEPFGVYIGNIYIDRSAADYGVNWGTGNASSAGMAGETFTLPQASCANPRVRFEYELKKGGQIIPFAGASFTPETDGAYTLTARAYAGENLLGGNNFAVTVSPIELALLVAPYYTFGADGLVTLPAASGVPEGSDIRYSVSLGGVDKTGDFDQNTRVFNTRGEKGDYTYKAELMNEETPKDEVSVTVKLHGSNVLAGLGDGADKAGFEIPGVTRLSYTTEKAAPGETGSYLLDNTWKSSNFGQFWIDLSGTDRSGDIVILKFWIWYEGEGALTFSTYNGGWADPNYWYGGVHYEGWGSAPITGEPCWRQVEVIYLRGAGATYYLCVDSADAGWTGASTAQIYLSNIYCVQ
ncbi:MAG: hypothetical protein LBL66_00610 [Clostridiales bacterium]|jgi:hypothetical protein|nr:hypothetical protein [Clostridiales bacterium]